MLHQIGSGALGPVFRGFDPAADRIVVIKTLKLEVLPELAAQLAARLRRLVDDLPAHPNVVAVLDAGLESSTPYLVVDCVTGDTLDVVLRRSPAPDPSAACRVVAGVAAALDAVRSAGVGHGCLHPRDVLIESATGAVRVTGFGVAAALDAVGIVAPVRRPYAAPERVTGPGDHRADVYALGALAHELLTGRRPMGPGEQDGEFPSTCTAAQRVAARRALGTALAARPDDRWDSAGDLAQALASAIGVDVTPIDAADRTQATTEDAGWSEPVDADAPAEIAEVEASVPHFGPATTGAGPFDVVAFDDFAGAAAPDRDGLPEVPAFVLTDSAAARAAHGRGRTVFVAIAAVVVGAVATAYLLREQPRPVDPAPPVATEVAVVPGPATGVAETEQPVAPPSEALPPAPVSAPVVDRPARAMSPAGALVVRSVPAGAIVTLNGRLIGETPATVPGLALGAHDVRVARPGYVPREERVTLSERTPTRTLQFALRPGLSPASARVGSLYVDSRPRGARVWIDGRLVGTTPLRVAEVGAGTHQVRIELVGYRPVSSAVEVPGGQEGRLAVTLERPVAPAAVPSGRPR